ncbi:MAG: hypothetical protein ABI411_16900 [Tahibacter sp.]
MKTVAARDILIQRMGKAYGSGTRWQRAAECKQQRGRIHFIHRNVERRGDSTQAGLIDFDDLGRNHWNRFELNRSLDKANERTCVFGAGFHGMLQ